VATSVGLLTGYSIFLEGGIAACHVIWLVRSRAVRRQARAQGKTFDEFVEGCVAGDPGFAFRERAFGGKKAGVRIEQC
jgi:Flp pilus assembly protein TadB